MAKIWCEKYLYFGISVYDLDKDYYILEKKHVMIFARNKVGLISITEIYEESIHMKITIYYWEKLKFF